MGRSTSVVVAVAALAIAGTAAAQPAGPADTSEAARLFEAGLAAQDHGDNDQACELFAQARAKDPRAIGALIGLGTCNERRGKIATAHGLFQQALEFATEAGFARQREAMQAKVTELAPKVPILELVVPDPLPTAKVLVDDIVVKPGELAVDPGEHVVVYTAAGRMPHQETFTIREGERHRVELAPLEIPKPRTIVTRVGNRRRSIGIATTIGGGAVVLIAGGLVLYANKLYDDQFADPDGAGPMLAACGGRPIVDGHDGCTPDGAEAVSRARTLGTTATVLTAVGLAAATVGVVVWVTAPSGETRTARVVPTAAPDGFGLAVVGGF